MTTTVGCLQPVYLPWIPFFERFLSCDYFVLLDDVDYSKHKFQNRTKFLIQLSVCTHSLKKNLSKIFFNDSPIKIKKK